MLKDIFQLYMTGRELGLSTREINNTLLFRNSKYSMIYTILLIIAVSALGFLVIILGIKATKNTYPSGTKYSIVKEKDFKKKLIKV